VQLAIKLKKPRWLLAHDHVVVARSLLKKLGLRGQGRPGENSTPHSKARPILDDLRVLDLYEEAIVDSPAIPRGRA
jgi:hypothetical protein